MAKASGAVSAATRSLPPGATAPAARFALELRPTQDPVAFAGVMQAALAPLAARVAPLSALEPRVLVAELPGRVFTDDGTAFAAAHALEEEFDLAAAEPDLPTDLFPEMLPSTDAKDPPREGLDGFPPGCWAPGQPELDRDPLWAIKAMRVPEAWAFSEARQRPSRGEGVVVAQPDTGITRHAELEDVVSAPGFDVLSGDADPTDPLDQGGNPGHGTATASVVVSPETRVISGTAPRARHMPIRAIESVIRITQVSVARAIDWAVEHDAHVITMSLGGIPSFSLHRALRRAVAADVIVLAAAGNCARFVVWPARYDECIAVGGTNWRHEPWRGSCRGSAVDVSAPAENVIRARVVQGAGPGADHVGQGQGTSFAVALTAGVAALWLAHHGRANLIAAARGRGETLQTMFNRLVRATALRPGVWDPFELGAGVVDARALLEADLDLERDREAVEPPADPRTAAALTVQSLVAESIGHEAALDDSLDWHRFGPEIANALLRSQIAAAGEAGLPAGEAGLRPEAPAEAGPPSRVVSDRLATAVGNPRLRDWLGLDAGLEPEVGREEGGS
jgi:serine protease